jgi:hypothetical protein
VELSQKDILKFGAASKFAILVSTDTPALRMTLQGEELFDDVEGWGF